MEIQEMIFVYRLICPIDNSIKYVGITNNPETRLNAHTKEISKTRKGKWLSLLRKRKLKPIMKIIDMVPESEKINIEQYYIAIHLKVGIDLFNVKIRKGTIKSHPRTKETGNTKSLRRIQNAELYLKKEKKAKKTEKNKALKVLKTLKKQK